MIMKLESVSALAPSKPPSSVRVWRPAPFRHGPSPFNFAEADRRALGQKRLGQTLFDHPLMGLALGAGATILAAAGTAKFEGGWRILSWAVLIAAGSQTLVSGVRYLGAKIPSGGAP
jgi:hypothetical protein